MEQVAKLKKTWNLASVLQVVQKVPENYCPCLQLSLAKFGDLNQPAHNVPGTSPEGTPKVLTWRTSRGPSEGQYKNWWFNKKIVFYKQLSLCYISIQKF